MVRMLKNLQNKKCVKLFVWHYAIVVVSEMFYKQELVSKLWCLKKHIPLFSLYH